MASLSASKIKNRRTFKDTTLGYLPHASHVVNKGDDCWIAHYVSSRLLVLLTLMHRTEGQCNHENVITLKE